MAFLRAFCPASRSARRCALESASPPSIAASRARRLCAGAAGSAATASVAAVRSLTAASAQADVAASRPAASFRTCRSTVSGFMPVALHSQPSIITVDHSDHGQRPRSGTHRHIAARLCVVANAAVATRRSLAVAPRRMILTTSFSDLPRRACAAAPAVSCDTHRPAVRCAAPSSARPWRAGRARSAQPCCARRSAH
jgi:hypothetical protein